MIISKPNLYNIPSTLNGWPLSKGIDDPKKDQFCQVAPTPRLAKEGNREHIEKYKISSLLIVMLNLR